MKRSALLISLLATLGFFSGCNSEDSFITCDRYDQWMASCDNCSMTIACEDNYDVAPVSIQMDLDDCADNVLMANLGICGDWTGAVDACVNLGATYLGIVCAETWCGDGYCDAGENETNCADDCDGGPYCGDGNCDIDEDEVSCAADCAVAPYCGDGTCDVDEDYGNCAEDCDPVCDDGVCDDIENPVDCPEDCAYLVCDDYQIWLTGCFTDCDILVDSCEIEYAGLDTPGAETVWDCAVELADAEAAGQCAEFTDSACDVLMEEALGSAGDCIVPGK